MELGIPGQAEGVGSHCPPSPLTFPWSPSVKCFDPPPQKKQKLLELDKGAVLHTIVNVINALELLEMVNFM